MSNVKKGHDYEREVKAMFIEHGWRCTRAAKSSEPADTIAYTNEDHYTVPWLFNYYGYKIEDYLGPASPFNRVAVRKTQHNIRKTYFVVVINNGWAVVLMQQKIYKRRKSKK